MYLFSIYRNTCMSELCRVISPLFNILPPKWIWTKLTNFEHFWKQYHIKLVTQPCIWSHCNAIWHVCKYDSCTCVVWNGYFFLLLYSTIIINMSVPLNKEIQYNIMPPVDTPNVHCTLDQTKTKVLLHNLIVWKINFSKTRFTKSYAINALKKNHNH